jgi:hypothetical protein
MQEHKTIAQLFQPPPAQWGLRGDPYLWDEMRDTLQAHAYPWTEEQFRVLLEQTYQQLVGVPITNRNPIFVERYAHGGMSSGSVSPQFWAEQAFPLLQERYRELT